MKLIRLIVGQLVLFINWLTFPKKGERAEKLQAEVESKLSNFSIYEFKACPFCVKTRRALQRLNLPIELRDAKNDSEARSALENEGGKIQVPCLRIKTEGQADQWMYESGEIINYLEKRFPLV